MHSRQNSKRANTGQFGNSFIDGEKLYRPYQKSGGMVTEMWAQPVQPPPKSLVEKHTPESTEKMHYKTKNAIMSLQKLGASKIIIPGELHKPLFLKRLMQYCIDELRFIGAANDVPGSPQRLQVYTHVFDLFIQEFKNYEPILIDIKREYELLIEKQRQDLSQFEIVKSKLSVMEFKMTQEINRVKNELHIILNQTSDQKNELASQLETKSYELVSLQNRFDALVAEQKRVVEQKPIDNPELQELRQMAQEYAIYEKKTRDLLDIKERQVVELLADKKKSQAELVDATAAFAKLKQSLCGTSGESVYVLEEKVLELKTKNEFLEKELSNSKEIQNDLEKNIKQVKVALQKSKESQNPDWEYIQSQFSNSIKDYFLAAKGMDYNDTIIQFIRELMRHKSENISVMPQVATDEVVTNSIVKETAVTPDQYFTGRGYGNNIPKFLQTKSKVLNRRLTKSNSCLLIKDVWEAKIVYDSSLKSGSISLSNFLYLYLKKRFGNQDQICEWGYNLMDSCQKYRDFSVDCCMFLDILQGTLDESVYKCLYLNIEKIKDAIYKMDLKVHSNVPKGYLEKSECVDSVAECIPTKPKKHLQLLQEALDRDQPGLSIIYKFMFESEADSEFLETIKQQENEERLEYIKYIEETVKKISKEETMSVFEAMKLLKEYDVDKTQAEIDEYIARGFTIPIKDLKPKLMTQKREFVKNIKRGPLGRGSNVVKKESGFNPLNPFGSENELHS